MDNPGVQKLRDNDPTKNPRAYPAEGEDLPVPQSDGDDNDPAKPPGTSYEGEGE